MQNCEECITKDDLTECDCDKVCIYCTHETDKDMPMSMCTGCNDFDNYREIVNDEN